MAASNLAVVESSVSGPEVWAKASARLRSELGEDAFGSWLARAALRASPCGELYLVTPTGVARDWIRRYAWRRIEELWSSLDDARPGRCACSPGPSSRRRPIVRSPAPRVRRPARRAGRRSRDRDQHAARPLHLRKLRLRSGQRVRLRRRPAGGVVGRRPLQPGRDPRPLWLWKDAPPVRHGARGHGRRPAPQGRLPDLRALPFRLRPRGHGPPDRPVQGAAAQRRPADRRRRSLHRRQAIHPGGVVPYPFGPDGGWPPSGVLRRPAACPAYRVRRSFALASVGGPGVRHRARRPRAENGDTERKVDLLRRQFGFTGQLRREVLDFLADRFTDNVRELEGALNTLVVRSAKAWRR